MTRIVTIETRDLEKSAKEGGCGECQETRDLEKSAKEGGCGECQTSCQSACKTSCGVANQPCEQLNK